MSTTLQVRMRPAAHQKLRELSERTHTSMQDTLERALEEYQRKVFFEEVNAAFARLKADPDAWAEELAERAEWDATLSDGEQDG
jgi:hypothetical protein